MAESWATILWRRSGSVNKLPPSLTTMRKLSPQEIPSLAGVATRATLVALVGGVGLSSGPTTAQHLLALAPPRRGFDCIGYCRGPVYPCLHEPGRFFETQHHIHVL